MKKILLFTYVLLGGFLATCSSGDDKATNDEAEMLMSDEENGLRLTASVTRSLEFCIFGSFCDENGRQAEYVQYEVSVWTYSGNTENPKGEILYEDELSPALVTDYTNGTSDTVSEPLCLQFPNTESEDEFYLEIALDGVIRSGILTETQIVSLYQAEGRLDYYHFREGNCNLGDSPALFN